MLPIVLIIAILSQGHATDYGTAFVTAFPENLAYYFPSPLVLQLKITTLFPSTVITVKMNNVVILEQTIASQQVSIVNIGSAEVNQFGIRGNTVIVTSSKNITVFSISTRGDSVQTNVVPPTVNLGTEYLVPALNYTDFAVQLNSYNMSGILSSSSDLLDFSYRLIIINAREVVNNIVVTEKLSTGNKETFITLDPFMLTQLSSSAYWYKVTSSVEAAVILTNPCIDSVNCKCNMIAHQLRPTKFMGTEFIYPPFNATRNRLFVTSDQSVDLSCNTETKTVQPGSQDLLPYLPGLVSTNPILTTSKPSSLTVISPGLIVNLISTDMFSGCFLVHSKTTAYSNALVIVETAQQNSLQIGNAAATGTTWEVISGTKYSWDLIPLTFPSSVIWHPTTPIAVYVFESAGTHFLYGGPAISINDEPDPNGCVLVPMKFDLSNITMSWQSSRAHCRNKGELLVSPNLNYTQNKMAAALNNLNMEGVAWLGLRRNLVTSEWNWSRSVPFDFANWDTNQPAGGLCASIIIEPNGNFTWSTERCCSPMLPLCATDMVILTTFTDTNLN
ncbi:uncharacterized protein LOC113647501 [Tachysurus fulvidraco]|uniref:uncharacterized protein LOC113647501 n=1 Tax=Tachysurus fulvidraco TaxID=1234273 RepID=UPI001FEE583E|nr:uncharacterized protein LOC113647501 [Tachysurus fulvidraco]